MRTRRVERSVTKMKKGPMPLILIVSAVAACATEPPPALRVCVECTQGGRATTRGKMAERTDRETASRRSVAGRWKPAADARADPGDAAGVDLDVVLARVVTRAVREACRRYFWQGRTMKLVSSNLASGDGATKENKDAAHTPDKSKKKRSPSYARRSEQRRKKYMEDKFLVYDDCLLYTSPSPRD